MSTKIIKNGNQKLSPITFIVGPNFSAGHEVTCRGANECRSMMTKKDGKFKLKRFPETKFTCYAAQAERYPTVFNARQANLRKFLKGLNDDPKQLEHFLIDQIEKVRTPRTRYLRLHESGDIITRYPGDKEYLKLLNNVAKYYENKNLIIYGYTKIAPLFYKFRLSENLLFTFSYGSKYDEYVNENPDLFNKKCSVINYRSEANGRPIDFNDFHGYDPKYKGHFVHLVHGNLQAKGSEASKAIRKRISDKKQGLETFVGYTGSLIK
jgi:hypothetical protein